MVEVFVRGMNWQDVPDVLKIERISFTTPWSELAFLKEISNTHSVAKVAVFDGEVAGYICAGYLLDEGHILNLAVHPELRRRGIATALVEKVINELRMNGCRVLFLEVRVSNLAAIEFYERFGFRPVGYRKDYYAQPREDAVLMKLDLDSRESS
jgi:ribosomal-protein-alanine N-acetyltransferase